MRKLFCLFGLLAISFTASAAGEWLYYKHYPWVYDNVSKDWLYFRGSSDGKVYAYRSSTNEWEVFEVPEPTWAQYDEWILDPEPYGGLEVLQQIKEAKDNNSTELNLYKKNITDPAPLKFLTNLEKLSIDSNNISDISFLSNLTKLTYLEIDQNQISDISELSKLPNLTNLWISQNNLLDLSPLSSLINLVGLSMIDCNISVLTPLTGLYNLEFLYLYNNPITKSQKAILEEALPNTTIYWPDEIIDDSQETEKTWEQKYEEWILDPEPYGGLSVLQQIKEAKDSGTWQLVLENKNISDISPLDGLTQFYYLNLEGNNIADISPLASLTNLESLDLDQNNIDDVSPLAGLTTLTGLELGGNNITNLTALSSLTNLNYLDLDGNPLSSEQKNLITEALPNTDLWFGN